MASARYTIDLQLLASFGCRWFAFVAYRFKHEPWWRVRFLGALP